MPPQNNDQFYFLNQTAAPKKSPLSILPSNGNSFKSRMLLVVGGAIIVIIILIIVFSILGNLGKGNNSKLVSVLENQSIVMDIANQGIKNSNDQPTVDLSTTIDNVLASDQNTYINTLIINGIKPTKNQLAVKNLIIDKNITIALGNGTFQNTYVSALQKSLNQYKIAIKTAYGGAKNKSQKIELTTLYDNVGKFIDAAAKLQSN